MKLTFRVYEGEDLVREETLDKDMIKIGKQGSCHLQLEGAGVARMHAAIEVTPMDELKLIDLGSDSGTFVNGKKKDKCALKDGDELKIGAFRVVLTTS